MTYISNAFVSEALDCARRGGVDVNSVLASSGITAPGGGTVSAEQFGQLWLGIAEAMNDEFFGNAARAMRPGSFTLMCHAVRDAPTVEIALRRALRFLRVAIDEPYGTLRIHKGLAEITLHDSTPERSAFAYRTYWVILHGLTCWLARTRIPLQTLNVSCSAPREAADYGDFFGAPVTFNATQGAMIYDAQYLKRPARRSDAALKRFLRAAPGRFLVGYEHDAGLAQGIAQRLRTTPVHTWPTLAEIAEDYGMSSATVRRRLSTQGTGFRELRSAALKEKAKLFLTETDMTVAQVSESLGYAEPSAFFRAFKGWTEHSPDHWRTLRHRKGPAAKAGPF